MKIYWIVYSLKEGNSPPLIGIASNGVIKQVVNGGKNLKCFFRPSKEKAEEEIRFRKEEEGLIGFSIVEEEIPDEKFGTCLNEDKPMLSWCPDCSVGQVRKMRNGFQGDDGTCKTCPYYIDKNVEDSKKEEDPEQIKGYIELKEYYNKTFPTQAPHRIAIMGKDEYKKYKAKHKSPWEKPKVETTGIGKKFLEEMKKSLVEETQMEKNKRNLGFWMQQRLERDETSN